MNSVHLLITPGERRSNIAARPFGRTTLLEDLRKEVQKYCDGEVSSAAVAAADFDPMLDIMADDALVTHVRRRQDGKRARYVKSFRQEVISVIMPERCPEEDDTGTQVRRVRLFIVDRQQIWLHMDDVEWAVKYLYVQNHLKGVPLVDDDSIGLEPGARREVRLELAVAISS